MSSISPITSYSSTQPPDPSGAYKYEDPTAYQIPTGYPNQFEVSLPLSRSDSDAQRDLSKVQSTGSSEPKIRLRKACDSCSVRKVKVRKPRLLPAESLD